MAAHSRELTIVQPSVGTSDPHVWTDAPDRLNTRHAVYEALVRPDGLGGHIGLLAGSWHTSDAQSWTFAIRPNVRFHDGRPLQASDVVDALNRARDPMMSGELGTTGLYSAYLGDAGIEVEGADRVRVRTPRPMADLLDLLADIPIISGPGRCHVQGGFAGTGPYRIVDGGAGWLRMEADAAYWAGLPLVRRLTWRAEPDGDARLRALLVGKADVATALPARVRGGVERERGIAIREVPTSGCVVFLCNAAGAACSDRRVRQALNHALDVPALIAEVKDGAARPLNGPLTPLSLGHDPSAPPYRHDPKTARRLLRDAGHANGLELELYVPVTTPDEAPALAEAAANQYAQVGIGLTVRMIADRAEYAAMVKAKQIGDLACFDSTPVSTYRVLREKFHGRVAGPWWQGYTNPTVDRAIDEASATSDPDARRDRYRQAFRLIRDDSPWVFLYSPTTVIGTGSGARGCAVESQGAVRFEADA